MKNLQVVKRDGSKQKFNAEKIEQAIIKAMKYGNKGVVSRLVAKNIAEEIEEEFADKDEVNISEIETLVYYKLISKKHKDTSRDYEGYRKIREMQRTQGTIDKEVMGLVYGTNKLLLNENSNKNQSLTATVRDLVAEEVSKDIAMRTMLPPHIVKAHKDGIIHLHDLGHYLNMSTNCLTIYNWVEIKENGKVSTMTLGELCEKLEVKPTINGVVQTIGQNIYIKDNKGWTPLLAVMARKTKKGEDIYKVKTANGMSISCTGEHRIPVLRDMKPVLSYVKDFTDKDRLFVLDDNYVLEDKYFDLCDMEEYTDDIRVIDLKVFDNYLKYKYDTNMFALSTEMGFDRFSHSKYKLYLKDFKKIVSKYPIPFSMYSNLRVSIKGSKNSFPLVIPYSEDLAKVYAYIYADGGVYVNEEQSLYTSTFTNTNLEIMHDFISCFENVFDIKLSIYNPSGNSPCYRASLGSKLLAYLFKNFKGAHKYGAGDMSIPDFVVKGTRQIKLAYISAALDTDGCASNNIFSYTTSSEVYAKQLMDLIYSLNYAGSITKRDARGTKYNINGVEGYRNFDNYVVNVKASNDAYNLFNELTSYKASKLKTSENVSVEGFERLPSSKIISITVEEEDTVVVDLETESNYFVANDILVHNCCLVNLQDMLTNGTCINGKLVESPHRFTTACTIATQIVAQVASGQFGGQTISLAHLAPFLRRSKEKFIRDLRKTVGNSITDELFDKIIKDRVQEELSAGVQTINYQCNTMQSSNGQSPFLSVFMYIEEDAEYEAENAMIIEEFLKQRLQGMKNEAGAWITPAFPKLLYVTSTLNITEDSKYFYITELAAKCIAKRMMPDLISEKVMKEHYEGNVFGCMGCRAWLSPYKGGTNNEEGQYKWYGRFNMGVTSINLADAGLSAEHDMQRFWEILDERLELCYESLILRYKKLENVSSDVSPIHFQYGALARLKKHESIKPLLNNNYATITLGYIGVYECVKALIGKSNTTDEGEKLAVEILQHLKEKVFEWKEETGLGFALYGTPSESLTEKFSKACRKRHGLIEGITDHEYLTNSFHVNVQEEIDPFKKLAYEAPFHKISSGGCISYIEMANMTHNIPAVIQMMQYMYETTQYAEFNTKSDYCQKCGFDGEIIAHKEEETGEWIWECPNCHNTDKDTMNVVRRTCGYLGENYWGNGRTEEIHDRVVHLDNHYID